MIKNSLLAIFLFLPSLSYSFDLPYNVDDTAIYENFEYLGRRILELDYRYILNNSTTNIRQEAYFSSITVTGQTRLALNRTDNVCIGKNQGGECSAGTNKFEVYAQAVNTDPLVVFNSSGNTSMTSSIDINNNASFDLRRGGDEITVVIRSTGVTSFSGGDVNVDEGSIGIGVNSTTGSLTIGGLKSITGYRNYTGLADTHEGLIVYPYINPSDNSVRVFDIVASGLKNASTGGSKLRFLTNPITADQGTPALAMEIGTNTVVQFTTAPFNTGSCPSGYKRVGTNECFTNSGNGTLVVSSTPAQPLSVAFKTYDIPTINSSSCKIGKFHVEMLYQSTAGLQQELVLHSRTPGSGVAAAAANRKCISTVDANPSYQANICEFEMVLDGDKDIDLLCQPQAIQANQICEIYIVGCTE